MKAELSFLGVLCLIFTVIIITDSGITGYSVLDIPSFIPAYARNLKVTNISNGRSYEYESWGEWKKAILITNDGSDKCASVSEEITDLKVYQIIGEERVDITHNAVFTDTDGNGLIDEVCWSVS